LAILDENTNFDSAFFIEINTIRIHTELRGNRADA